VDVVVGLTVLMVGLNNWLKVKAVIRRATTDIVVLAIEREIDVYSVVFWISDGGCVVLVCWKR
jgi:uncharacterized membrane protein YidH (DUF202 family)